MTDINNTTQPSLSISGKEISLTPDELTMMREGVVPVGIKEIAEGVSEEELINRARAVILPEIHISISERDGVFGIIRNGRDGLVQWSKVYPGKADDAERVNSVDLIRFSGHIGPVYLMDGEVRGIGLSLNGVQYVPMILADFYSLIRQELSVPAPTMQKMKEVINSWVNQTVVSGEYVTYRNSPIYVDRENVIKVDFRKVSDPKEILTKLRDFHDKATHPLAFRTVFAWALMAPIHDALKMNARKIIQVPNIVLEGKTKGGKTPLADFFLGKGYAIEKDRYFYSYERVATRFTLMKHLGSSNLPALLDDLPPDWIWQNRGNLKSYSQTGHFGDRGRSDQTINEYRGRRSFVLTVNDIIRKDDDLASANRLLIIRYTEKNRLRKNLPEWNALMDALPDGFMIEIFRALFEGKNISDIARDVENFQIPADWVNYVIEKLNAVGKGTDIQEWATYSEEIDDGADSNALEVAQAFLAEWGRIERNEEDYYDKSLGSSVRAVKYRSPIEGEFAVEWKGDRYHIYFTGSAFKKLTERLRLPYKHATDFLNNVLSSDISVRVENEGQSKLKKVSGQVLRCYVISVPVKGDPDEMDY